jgi:hypothetical protein|tara:strand:+ start:1501 stop:1689 length:189 start_codon:yes stop_codon:yes gene_type:complete
MIQIKRFIDKIATMEGRQGRDVVIPIADARALRDEITKLVLDQTKAVTPAETIEVVMKGSRW